MRPRLERSQRSSARSLHSKADPSPHVDSGLIPAATTPPAVTGIAHWVPAGRDTSGGLLVVRLAPCYVIRFSNRLTRLGAAARACKAIVPLAADVRCRSTSIGVIVRLITK
jgi:hypothetical protein